MQVEALKWVIDDILLTCGTGPDHEFRVLSCKSNKQVTAEKLPAEFVADCWRQWLQRDPNPLRKGKDGFVLVTRGRDNQFMGTWTELKNYATGSDPVLALARMQATDKFQTMFASVKAPAKAAGFDVSDADVFGMIRAIDVEPFDFQIVGSQVEQNAVTRCRLLLTRGSSDDGRELWLELNSAAKQMRLISGTVALAELLARLRGKFKLRDHPDYSSSWAALRARSSETRGRIETTLTTGTMILRADDTKTLSELVSSSTVSVLFGDSGSGKSALLKATLNTAFPDAEQVWLDPSNIELLLNQVTRVAAGVEQPLPQVLLHSAANAILIIDAAERLSREGMKKAKALVAEVQAASHETGCTVILIGQTDAWVDGRLQELAGSATPAAQEVKALLPTEVLEVLTSTQGLAPLASDSAALHALSNVRTLSWVVEAASQFQLVSGTAKLSLVKIADRLWTYWTDSKPTIQRLLMRLAEREANFEHSFALSELDAGDVAALEAKPACCPLVQDPSTKRIRFSHDLASEWARFQRLRELGDSVHQWQALASNPFWHGPIRMLGQHLSRVRMGERSGWAVAYEAAEKNGASAALADDLLLDALFLDPDADTLLESQVELLFADDGRRLLRLLRRFAHVASEPRGRPATSGKLADLSLYIEAEFRTPIYGRWPPMACFLWRHRTRAAALLSAEISKLCERWLTATPLTLRAGQPMPYRHELATLALACARELQVTFAKHDVWGLHDVAKLIIQAALAAGGDLPTEVGAWALEMSGRRTTHADVLQRVAAYHTERAEEHARKMQSDAPYRAQQERLKSLPPHLPSGRKLPPWPLGPQRSIERSFREATLGAGSLSALMRAAPDVAAEVLLACLIEDDPTEEYSRPTNLDQELGIEFDSDGYPTAPWKSSFILFLGINADMALAALIKLVDFATERWAHAVRRHDGSVPQAVLSLNLGGGVRREYAGYSHVFNWSHDNSTSIGQLHSALAALEQWLCDSHVAGRDMSATIDHLLNTSGSTAFIGVLSNLAKSNPELLRGPLRSLTGSQYIYRWDFIRVETERETATAAGFVHGGEMMYEMGKQWLSRPYRRVEFTDVVCGLIESDADLGEYVLAEMATWRAPKDRKAALEHDLLRARLDYRNYPTRTDSATGSSSRGFVCPPQLAAAVQIFRNDSTLALHVLSFRDDCLRRLPYSAALQPEEAERVAALFDAIDADSALDLEEDLKSPSRIAAASLLALRAGEWLVANPAVAEKVERLIQAELGAVTDAPDDGPRRHGSLSSLQFVAWVAMERWLENPSRENEQTILKVLVSGDGTALTTLFSLALMHRSALGQNWWRLHQVALLWSGLLILKPRHGDDEVYTRRWRSWRQRLAAFSLSAKANLQSLDFIAVGQAVWRLDALRTKRREDPWQRERPRSPVPYHGGLRTDVLGAAFTWLIKGSAATDSLVTQSEQTALLNALWDHHAWWLVGSAKENGDLHHSGEFGYELVARLAWNAHRVPVDESTQIWAPVFALGPRAHYLISHFIGAWFMQLSASTVASDWAPRWRTLLEYVVTDKDWLGSKPWYQRETLTRKVMGMHFSEYIQRVPSHSGVILAMRDLFHAWAKEKLVGDEDNPSEFCFFLASEAGKPLRLDGLAWLAAAKASKPTFGSWRRPQVSGSFIQFLNVLVAEQSDELRSNQPAKAALLELATLAEAQQLKAAMSLLERIRRL
jgi:hypothetical protein